MRLGPRGGGGEQRDATASHRPQFTQCGHARPTPQQLLLVVRPTEMHRCTKTCPEMFTAGLRLTASNWRQPRCPAAGGG